MSSSTPRDGGGRVGIVENWELRQRRRTDANSGAFKGMLFVVVALLLITVGGWYAARPMVGPFLTDAFEEHPGIINYPIVGDLVATEFADRLDDPAGNQKQSSSSSSPARRWPTSRPTSSMRACSATSPRSCTRSCATASTS